jgi:GNAT superfamily N-acetyltransferase
MFEIYRHYKGNHYVRIVSALHSEELGTYEVYRTLYDNPKSRVWVRPKEMFHGVTDEEQRRFSLVGAVARAVPEDEAELSSFGYDAWSSGRSLAEFVASDPIDPDTRRGERWFLQNRDGEKVSVLNVLRFTRGLMGIASVATRPSYRGKGFASLLLRAVMELLLIEDPSTRFLLFAEGHSEMYERLGFRALPDADQHCRPALAMMAGGEVLTADERGFVRVYF